MRANFYVATIPADAILEDMGLDFRHTHGIVVVSPERAAAQADLKDIGIEIGGVRARGDVRILRRILHVTLPLQVVGTIDLSAAGVADAAGIHLMHACARRGQNLPGEQQGSAIVTGTFNDVVKLMAVRPLCFGHTPEIALDDRFADVGMLAGCYRLVWQAGGLQHLALSEGKIGKQQQQRQYQRHPTIFPVTHFPTPHLFLYDGGKRPRHTFFARTRHIWRGNQAVPFVYRLLFSTLCFRWRSLSRSPAQQTRVLKNANETRGNAAAQRQSPSHSPTRLRRPAARERAVTLVYTISGINVKEKLIYT